MRQKLCGQMEQCLLRVRYFLSDEQPPEQLVTSVRCLVFQNDSVLALRNRKGNHILPGGRREEGETFEQTLRPRSCRGDRLDD